MSKRVRLIGKRMKGKLLVVQDFSTCNVVEDTAKVFDHLLNKTAEKYKQNGKGNNEQR